MTDAPSPQDLLFNRTGLDETRVQSIVEDALAGADDGELFMEYSQSESLAFDDGRLKTASFDTQQGFGLRAVAAQYKGDYIDFGFRGASFIGGEKRVLWAVLREKGVVLLIAWRGS